MADELKPALTADEWARLEVKRCDGASDIAVHPISTSEKVLSVGNDDYDTGSGHGHDSFPAFMALANAALPDDSPYKLRREDVELLRIARDAGRIEGGLGGEPIRYAGRPLHFGEHNRLRALADKLAALLPPETPDTPPGDETRAGDVTP